MKTKMMFFVWISTFVISCSMMGQEYKVPVENTKDGKLSLINFMGDLPIVGYNGNEIVITSDDVEQQTPERAKGLKAIYPAGTDNTGMALFVEKNGNQITITCLLPITKHGEYKLKVPENLALNIQSGCERSNIINIHGMKSEIEINNCQNITLNAVSGPLVISTISGNVEVTIENLAADKPCSINSISGEIDVTLPAKTAVNLELGSLSGTIYSDFDFGETSKKMKQVGGKTTNFKLNGGGSNFNLVTVSGNIYLRKGK